MSKTLAIKGRETQGIEVIKLLEMMGGKNCFHLHGLSSEHAYYFIGGPRNDEIRAGDYIFDEYAVLQMIDDMCFFTLEEFLEKYPFKVGDIVDRTLDNVSCIIDNMRWNSEKCCVEYHLNYLNGGEYGWHVSECLMKPENVDVIIGRKIESTGFMQMGKTVSVIFNSVNYDEVELQLGDYEIEVRDGRTYAVRKKPKYPTTYGECCQHLGCDDKLSVGKLIPFQQLINARNAYWKIAGKEMGLDKPWEPNWTTFEGMPAIFRFRYNIVCDYIKDYHCLLVFPTIEMRDTFYENFKDLIEQCKELL